MSKYLGIGEHTVTLKKLELKHNDDCRKPWVTASVLVKSEGKDGKEKWEEVELAPVTNAQGVTTAGRQKFVNWQLEALGLGVHLTVDEHGAPDTDKLVQDVRDALLEAEGIGTTALIEVKGQGRYAADGTEYTEVVFKKNLGLMGLPAPQPKATTEDVVEAFDAVEEPVF
jgi:hypothetical protein